jgi:hypothetical protein
MLNKSIIELLRIIGKGEKLFDEDKLKRFLIADLKKLHFSSFIFLLQFRLKYFDFFMFLEYLNI